jgi:stage III sporulation protein AG
MGDFKKEGVLARLRRIKHIEKYAAAAVIVVMVLIFFSSLGTKSKPTSAPDATLNVTEQNYVREMEQKLTTALSTVAGVGSVTVMVTAVGSSTLEIAYNVDEKTVTNTGSGGTSTSTATVTKTPVIVNGKPLIIAEIKPKLSGILVIAAGASDLKIRLAIENAIHAVVPDNSVKIQVLTHK